MTLVVEQQCTWTYNTSTCELALDQDNVAGLPLRVPMIDNGNGTYYADYSVTAPGTVSVSVDLYRTKILGLYWSNKERSGDPDII